MNFHENTLQDYLASSFVIDNFSINQNDVLFLYDNAIHPSGADIYIAQPRFLAECDLLIDQSDCIGILGQGKVNFALYGTLFNTGKFPLFYFNNSTVVFSTSTPSANCNIFGSGISSLFFIHSRIDNLIIGLVIVEGTSELKEIAIQSNIGFDSIINSSYRY
jgi:hypothetical protein